MRLFNIFVVAAVVSAGQNRNDDDIDAETHQQLKKACKSQIKNKVESDKFATKLEACLEKKIRKYKKQKAKEADRADRVEMKEEVNALKEEKNKIKEERNMCKAACNDLADQRTKQNCLDYWKTASREKIQQILKQVGDKKDRNGDTTYCYTDAGLTGNETTCKESADQYCENIGLERPSKPYRDCRSACLGDCMAGNDCTFAADDAE